GCIVEFAVDAPSALTKLKSALSYDLVISHWGYKRGAASTAEALLSELRQNDIRVPALLYSTRERANERKQIAVGLGAQGYYFTNDGLLDAIENLLRPGTETG